MVLSSLSLATGGYGGGRPARDEKGRLWMMSLMDLALYALPNG
jgi:hypothetical protein